jgi:hypothetical protein
MKIKFCLLLILFLVVLSKCTYKNEEDEYYKTSNNSLDSGLIAHFSFEQSLADLSKNKISPVFNGTPEYVANPEIGNSKKALSLNGVDNWLEIPVLQYDTIAISLFFKRENMLADSQEPSLFDYGNGAVKLNLDAVSGGTYLAINDSLLNEQTEDWINSYEGWNYIYIESFLSKKMVTIFIIDGKNKNLSFSTTFHSPLIMSNEKLFVGRNFANSQQESYFRGVIDELRIYNRKLSENELLSISSQLSK